MHAFSGPLPPPPFLPNTTTLFPTGESALLRWRKSKQEHRLEIEHKVVHANSLDQRLGLIFGFIVMMSAVGVGFWCVVHDKDTAGITALIGAVAAPVVAFIYGRKKQAEERKNKQ